MSVLLVISRDAQVEALVMWSLQIAVAAREELRVLWCEDGAGIGEPGRVDEAAAGEGPVPAGIWNTIRKFRHDLADHFDDCQSGGRAEPEGWGDAGKEPESWPRVVVERVVTANVFRSVMRMIDHECPSLLIAEKEQGGRGADATTVDFLALRLFERVPCDTLLIRVSEADGSRCRRILVPAAGGRHSRRALELGDQLARCCPGGELVPLFVQANIDEVAREVGEKALERALSRAGIKESERGHIALRVVLGGDIDKAIREEARAGEDDLVIIGASNVATVRRKLFGTIPDRVLSGENAATVAVMRKAQPLAERVRRRVERVFDLTVPQIRRSERVRLFEDLQHRSRWSFDFMTLICLSTAIASLGLIQNSVAVVIGAMLVAPLMTPLLGAGLAIVQGNGPLIRVSAKSIMLGFFWATLIGVAMGVLARPYTGLTSELLARGGPPTLLDMGVAFLSGIAAAYCLARPGLSSALAGVAIAAALVPPIATVGISLALGETINARGAAILFGTNVVAIILGAALNFYAAGIRGRKTGKTSLWVRRTFFGLMIALAVLAVPLGSVILSRVVENRISRHSQSIPDELRIRLDSMIRESIPEARLTRLATLPDAEGGGDGEIIEIHITSPSAPSRILHQKLQSALARHTGNPDLALRLHTDLVIEPNP